MEVKLEFAAYSRESLQAKVNAVREPCNGMILQSASGEDVDAVNFG